MKIKQIFRTMAMLAIVACAACQQQPSFTIVGTVEKPELEGKMVYLMIGDGFFPAPTDSTIVSDGKYSFKGSIEQENAAKVVINPYDWDNRVYVNLALENARIVISTDKEGVTTVSGTKNNDKYQEFLNAKKPYEERFEKAYKVYEASAKTAEDEITIDKERDFLHEKRDPLSFNYVKENINNPAFWFPLYNVAIQSSFEKQKELIAAANDYTKQQPVMQTIIQRVETMEKTAVGNPYVDLHMLTPDDKEIALSEYVGKSKYLLVDFWASWCGPCRAEIPNVKVAYEKYKNKGLEIVGVSFDSKKESWIKAIKDLDIAWPQMSDLKGWDSEGAKAYAITGIPHVILLDQEGKIVARQLYGEELQKKLSELFDAK